MINIPYGRQEITDSDINYVISILKSDFLTQGPVVPLFESLVNEKMGAKFAVAVNSATSALHIACLSLGLQSGDWLWTTPISFVASANCGLYCGANVDFVDIDPLTLNLSIEALDSKLINASVNGSLPKILVVVHFSGNPCNMRRISELSRKYGFKVIEDASHAIGGKYLGEYIGSCRYSDITIFSFHPVKIITTGEGGMALTNDPIVATKMELLRSHGITRDPNKMTDNSDGAWYYQQIELGFNYRMTELQAALGVSQLQRLDDYVLKRHELAERYNFLLRGLPVITPFENFDGYSSLHLYVIRLQLNQINKTRTEVFNELRTRGIGVNVHYIPIHTQPYYRQIGFAWGDFPVAEEYYREAISLPMFQTLTLEEQDVVVKSLTEVLSK